VGLAVLGFVLKLLLPTNWAAYLFAGLGGLLGTLIPGLVLIGIGLLAALVAAEREGRGQYVIVDRAGWCERTRPSPVAEMV
jgi:hypothetical protein